MMLLFYFPTPSLADNRSINNWEILNVIAVHWKARSAYLATIESENEMRLFKPANRNTTTTFFSI